MRDATRGVALTRANECGRVLPLLLLLVLESEIVAHHDKVSVLISVLKSDSQDVSEGIQARASFALRIINLKRRGTVKELEEV